MSAYTRVKMKDAPEGLSKDLDQITESRKATTLGLNRRSGSTVGAQAFPVTHWLDICGKEHLRKF